MNPVQIIFRVVALAAVTFVVLLLIPAERFRAGARGEVGSRDFAYGESANVPPRVSLPNRNLMNLLELPVLFYVVCLAFYVTRSASASAVTLAWTYVGLRAAHSVIHLTYNRVSHRALGFAARNERLVMLWIRWAATLSAS